jgi:hypothetical protein
MKALAKVLSPAAVLLAAACSAGAPTGAGSSMSTTSAASTTPAASSGTTAGPRPASTGPTANQQRPVPTENNPPGDIPDNVAFVLYTNRSARFTFRHPEGWAEKERGASVTFTDKLNGVQVLPGSGTTTSVQSARSKSVPELRRTQAAFELRSVAGVREPVGAGVRIVYRRNSAPDEVTGKQYRDEVERYELVAQGRVIVMELFGPVGADNVDAYRTMVKSLRVG